MVGTFACPDCGSELRLDGLAPGLLVRCTACGTQAEVPFIPRLPSHRSRSGRKAPWWSAWAWAALALSAVLIAVSTAGRISQAREREARQTRLDALTGEADAKDRAGMPGLALAEIEAALNLARMDDGAPADQIRALARRRDELARREISLLLETPPSTNGDYGVGIWEGLALRATRDSALVALSGEVLARRDEAKVRWANAELAEARRVSAEGDPTGALALTDHAMRLANGLHQSDAAPLEGASESLVRRLVREYGVVIEPTRGEYSLGTSVGYDALLAADLARSLTDRGYLPRPSSKTPGVRWLALWPDIAPYRASMRIVERYLGNYLQSQNRMSRVAAELRLMRGGDQAWLDRVEAQTSDTLSAMPGYLASRLGTARQSASDERVLYEDARERFVRAVRRKMTSVPRATPGLIRRDRD